MKERYNHMMDQFTPEEALVRGVCAGGTARRKGTRRRRAFRPGLAAAAAVLACILLATPALAANVPGFHAALYAVSPATAQFFVPVQRACEDNGIRMEVAAAYLRGDTAELYVTMQDLTGDRIDETTDLYDSYSIRRPFDSTAGCRLADYDADTRTATFLITMNTMDGSAIRGGKVTFSVGEFLSHKQTWDNVAIALDLTDLPAAQTREVESNGGSGALAAERKVTVLVPGTPYEAFPVKGIDLTAVGYVDGKLHVQIAMENRLENDNHGFFYLVDGSGERTSSESGIYYCNHYEREGRIDYYEAVFDVPEEEIGNYTLSGDFVTCDSLTRGNWCVTFPLRNMEA